MLSVWLADGEIAAVGKHAPDPFERTEAEIVKPQFADSNLEEEDDDGRQFDGDEAERSAQPESQTVEQDSTNDRLHDVTMCCGRQFSHDWSWWVWDTCGYL